MSTMAATSPRALLQWCFFLACAGIISSVTAQDVVVVTIRTTLQAAKTVRVAPTIPSPASYTSLEDFKDTVLKASNDYRRTHDAGPLVWNETLVQYSRRWADNCIWKHSVRRFVSTSYRAHSSANKFD